MQCISKLAIKHYLSHNKTFLSECTFAFILPYTFIDLLLTIKYFSIYLTEKLSLNYFSSLLNCFGMCDM